MIEYSYPVRWVGAQAVVALPEHVDVSNAGQIREELLWVINRGAVALIADMTATVSCDHAGADAVLRARRRAVASGTEIRLVATAPIVRRVLAASGLQHLVPVYPFLEAAMAAGPPAAVAAPAVRAGPRASGRAPARGAALVPGKPTTHGTWPAIGMDITPGVVQALLDAMPDAVALADGDGVIALASGRLAEMFGYQQPELTGCPAESLIPARLRADRRGWHAASTTEACAAGSGAWGAGLRKDGSTFPVEISISPVAAAAGDFTLIVIRDLAGVRRLEDSTWAAAAQQHANRGPGLPDTTAASIHRPSQESPPHATPPVAPGTPGLSPARIGSRSGEGSSGIDRAGTGSSGSLEPAHRSR